MSNGNGNGVNLTRIASPSLRGGAAPLPGSGESAKKEAGKYTAVTEHTTVKRAIPVTDYEPPEAEEPEAEPGAVVKPADAAAEDSRHEKWRAAQATKKATTDAVKLETLAKRQGLASVLLGKGDLTGAAKALGIPASELVTLVNQAAIGLKPEPEKPKELTPQEKLDADRTAFAKEMQEFRDEQKRDRNARAMQSFLDSDIRPVLADKDAYEMIHAAGAADIETYAYRYMNAHYAETAKKDENGGVIPGTGEVLKAKDVLDAIEENLVTAAEASLARQRDVKKLGKHFAPRDAAAVVESAAGSTALSDSRRARISAAMAALGAEDVEEPEPEPEVPPKIVRAPAGGNIRATALTRGRSAVADRIARARSGQ